MTQSQRCWFIANIWKSDHHLSMTLGTDIKFAVDESEFCLISRLKSFEVRTVRIQMGRGVSHDMDSAVLSVSHTSVTSAITFKQLLNFVFLLTISAPQSPNPFAQIKTDASAMHKCSQPEGTEALRHTQTASHSARSWGSATFKCWFYTN